MRSTAPERLDMHTDDPYGLEVLIGDGLVSSEDLSDELRRFYEDYIDTSLALSGYPSVV